MDRTFDSLIGNIANSNHIDPGWTASGSEMRLTSSREGAEMLEELDAEPVLHDRHRNLILAAIGAGRAVITALDRRLVDDVYRRGLTLLFVAQGKRDSHPGPPYVPGGVDRSHFR